MIDVMNKTYEQYREEIKPDIYAEEGEEITCQNGHHINNFACTTYIEDDLSSLDFSESTLVLAGHPDKCIRCNALFLRIVKKGPLKYSKIIQFWMDGEWREGKYK